MVGAWKIRIRREDITPWKQNLPHSIRTTGMLSGLAEAPAYSDQNSSEKRNSKPKRSPAQ